MTLTIQLLFLCISLYVAFKVWSLSIVEYDKEHLPPLVRTKKIKLMITGFLANIADTLGIGSFAVVVMCDRIWTLIPRKELLGTLNTHSVFPAFVQSLFFLQFVSVDVKTLMILLAGSILGTIIASLWALNVSRHLISKAMLAAYGVMFILLCLNQMGLFSFGGHLLSLSGIKLTLGFFLMLGVGFFPAFGVGGYVPTQLVLFSLGMSPIVAFPIMCSAGFLQQSVAAMTFIKSKRVAIKEASIMSIFGLLGVALVAPFVANSSPLLLRWILLIIVAYNVLMLFIEVKKMTKISK